MKEYKVKEVLLSMQQSIDSLKEKFEILLEVIEDSVQYNCNHEKTCLNLSSNKDENGIVCLDCGKEIE